jgi:hypothetical protein
MHRHGDGVAAGFAHRGGGDFDQPEGERDFGHFAQSDFGGTIHVLCYEFRTWQKFVEPSFLQNRHNEDNARIRALKLSLQQ